MIHTLEGSAYYKIIEIDLVGMHPDQRPQDYFASQLGIAMQENRVNDGLFLRTITWLCDAWIVVFHAE